MTSRKQKESPKKTQISVTEEEKCSSDCDSAHQRRDKIIQDATAAIGDIRAKEKTKKKVDEKAVTSKVFAMTRSRSKDIQVTHESLPSKLSRQRNTILKTATESLKNVAPKKAVIVEETQSRVLRPRRGLDSATSHTRKLSKSAVNLSKVKNVTETRSELQEPANLVRNSMSTFDLRPGSNIKKVSKNVTQADSTSPIAIARANRQRKQTIQKIHRILQYGLDNNWSVSDFGNRTKLRESYARGSLIQYDQFRNFLDKLHTADNLTVITDYIIRMTQDATLAKSVAGELGHFYCRRLLNVASKVHQPGCPKEMSEEEFREKYTTMSEEVLQTEKHPPHQSDLGSKCDDLKFDTKLKTHENDSRSDSEQVELEINDNTQSVNESSSDTVLLPRDNKRMHITISSSDTSSSDSRMSRKSVHEMFDKLHRNRAKHRTFSADEVLFIRKGAEDAIQFNFSKPFTFTVPFEEWKQVWNTKTNKPVGKSAYPEVFQKMFTGMKIPCSYNSNGYQVLSKNSELGVVKFKGYCRKARTQEIEDENEKCQMSFSVYMQSIAQDQPVQFRVEADGSFQTVQKHNTARQIRGVRREKLRHTSKHEKPKKMYLDAMTSVEDFQFFHGNLPAQSLEVFQKIRSEALTDSHEKTDDSSTDIHVQLLNLQKKLKHDPRLQSSENPEWNGFIHRINPDPHSVQMYSPMQIKFASICDTFYLDSTGQMVKNFKGKQVLLHSMLGAPSDIDPVSPVPVLEFLAQSSTRLEVEVMLRGYTTEIRKVKPSWRPKIIVTDFSLAYLHALSLGFNEVPLEEYINRKYDNTMSELQPKAHELKTTMFVCSGHFLHFVSKYMNKKTLNKPAVTSAMHAFGHLIESKTKQQYTTVMDSVISLFGSKRIDENVQQEIVHFLNSNEINYDEIQHLADYQHTIKSDIIMEDIIPEEDARIQKERIKFHKFFQARKNEILSKKSKYEGKKITRNTYYEPSILSTFERWNVYVPLWSKLAFEGSVTPSKTITTGYVENYFGQIKNSIHTVRNMREDLFIKEHSHVANSMVSDALAKGFFIKTRKVRRSRRTQMTPDAISTPYKRSGNPAFEANKWGSGRKKGTPKYTKNVKRLQKNPAPLNPSHDSNESSVKESPTVHDQTEKTETKRIVSSIPRYVNSDDGEKLLDPLQLANKSWSLQTKVIPQLIKGMTDEEFGDEQDVITLHGGRFVSSVVAARMSLRILQAEVDTIENQTSFVLDPTIVTGTGDLFQVNAESFPAISKELFMNSQLYLISFLDNHAFLTHIDVPHNTIFFYDSLNTDKAPLAIRQNVRFQRDIYFHALINGLNEYYSTSRTFKIVQNPCPEQIGNECVQMALLNFLAVVQHKDPMKIVSPNYAKVYRFQIANSLLQETEAGTALLEKFNNNVEKTLEALDKRQKVRDEINVLFRKRNEVAELHKNACDTGNNDENTPEWITLNTKLKALENDVKLMDRKWAMMQETVLNNCELNTPAQVSSDCQNKISSKTETKDRKNTKSPPARATKQDDVVGKKSKTTTTKTAAELYKIATDPASVIGGFSFTSKLVNKENVDEKHLTPEELRFKRLRDSYMHTTTLSSSDEETQRDPGIFPDLEEKKKVFEFHARKISNLTLEKCDNYVDLLKTKVKSILSGHENSLRMEMFKKGKRGMELRNLVVSDPFTTAQYVHIFERISKVYFNDDLPDETAMDLMQKVVMPEVLIHIFMHENDVSHQMAESEMKRGPYYDGPVVSINED